jgi:hypothetical protein
MKTVTYTLLNGKKKTIEYDENAPCIICGEPVLSASMGGTVICPSCDVGKCRYCGITICILGEQVDGGKSKQELLNHMKWHHENNPELGKAELQTMTKRSTLKLQRRKKIKYHFSFVVSSLTSVAPIEVYLVGKRVGAITGNGNYCFKFQATKREIQELQKDLVGKTFKVFGGELTVDHVSLKEKRS